MTNEEIAKDIEKFKDAREAFYDLIDTHIPKKQEGVDKLDFENAKAFDAKELYEAFFKLDYSARKLRGIIYAEKGV